MNIGYMIKYTIFDSYVKNSIKRIAQKDRLQGSAPIQFKIITNVTMKKLLSHTQDKDEKLEAFICQVYKPGLSMTKLVDL